MTGYSPDNSGRVIREAGPTGSFEVAQKNTDSVIAAERARVAVVGTEGSVVAERVLVPYVRRPLMSGDPASDGGSLVSASELAPDALALIKAGDSLRTQDFIPTPNQVVFDLSPDTPGPLVYAVINEVFYYPPLSLTISGNLVIWMNAFTLDANDRVRIYY